jgi:hypothetical protein
MIGGSGFYIDETGTRHFYNTFSTFSQLAAWSSPAGSSNWSADTAGLPVFEWGRGITSFCSDQQGYLYAASNSFESPFLYRRPLNGTIWIPDTNGLGQSFVYASRMASSASSGLILAIGTQLFRRTVNGWDSIPTVSGISSISAISVDDSGVIYITTPGNTNPDSLTTYYTTNNGGGWQVALTGMHLQSLISNGDKTYALTLGNWGYVLTSHVNNVNISSDSSNVSTGISPIPGANSGIKVFPNPSTSGVWNLQTGNEWADGQIEVYDVSGKLVYRNVINSATTQLAAQNLASGIYQLHVTSGNKGATEYLIK